MKKTLLAVLLTACAAVHAEPWIIDDKTKEECAKAGGCILTIPDGALIPTEQVNQLLKEIQKQAFEAGVEKGAAAKTCTGKDV